MNHSHHFIFKYTNSIQATVEFTMEEAKAIAACLAILHKTDVTLCCFNSSLRRWEQLSIYHYTKDGKVIKNNDWKPL